MRIFGSLAAVVGLVFMAPPCYGEGNQGSSNLRRQDKSNDKSSDRQLNGMSVGSFQGLSKCPGNSAISSKEECLVAVMWLEFPGVNGDVPVVEDAPNLKKKSPCGCFIDGDDGIIHWNSGDTCVGDNEKYSLVCRVDPEKGAIIVDLSEAESNEIASDLFADEPPVDDASDARIPTSITINVRGTPVESPDNDGINHARGQLDVSDLGPDLSKVQTIRFRGIHRVSENAVTVFKRIDTDESFPAPTMWRQGDEELGEGLVEVPAQAWYGEEAGQGQRTAILMADDLGNLIGTLTDDGRSYEFHTAISSITGKKVVFDAVVLADIPDEDGPEGDDEGRRLADTTAPLLRKSKILSVVESKMSAVGSGVDTSNSTAMMPASSAEERNLQVGTVMIDIMVLYTAAARQYFGSHRNIKNNINMGMYQINHALWNSNRNRAYVRLVRSEEVGISDNSGRTATHYMNDLKTTYAGRRTQFGADFLHLIFRDIGIEPGRTTAPAGRGDIGGYYAISKASAAFRSGQYTFAHEVGHNLNARHDGNGMPNNQGFCYNGNTPTIMTYRSRCGGGSRILYYSGPNSIYNGVTMGNSNANNAQAIWDRALTARDSIGAAPAYVTLCEHHYCSGTTTDRYYASVSQRDWLDMPPDVPNDALSEIQVPPGYMIEVYEHSNFGGWSNAVGSKYYWRTRRSSDWRLPNDVISSFKVRPIPSGGVFLCKHHSCYSGTYRYYDYVDIFGWMPSEVPNDSLSRLYIYPGWKVTIFEHSYFGGWQYTFGHPTQTQDIYLGSTWLNDRTSSFKISVW